MCHGPEFRLAILPDNQLPLLQTSVIHMQAYDVYPFLKFRKIDGLVPIGTILAVVQLSHEIMHPDMGFPA